MNMLISKEFGQYFVRLPLKKSANIIHGNALQTDWERIISKNQLSYILGNPPFVGSRIMNKQQKQDLIQVFDNAKAVSELDYVTAWYIKSAKYIQNTNIKVAFVSTNSITQGLQTSILWGILLNKYKIKIFFAHRTFKWKNEAKGNAAVYCVIIGFYALTPSPSPKGRENALTPSPSPKGRGEKEEDIALLSVGNKEILKALKPYAKEMKLKPTPAEDEFWQNVRNSKLGVKFRRQHLIEQFIVDFYCHSLKLVVEIDGEIYQEQKEYDELRTEFLESLGLSVIRFTNEEVLENIYQVLGKLKEIINQSPLSDSQASHLSPEERKEKMSHYSPRPLGEGLGVRALLPPLAEGFGLGAFRALKLYEYASPNAEPTETIVKNINPYLVDGSNLLIGRRQKPLCDVPEIVFGSMPNDGGHLILSLEEKNELIAKKPALSKFIRPLLGSDEFINGYFRYCFWLKDINPAEFRIYPEIMQRIEKVKQHRLSSTREATKKLAQMPYLFAEIRQPNTDYILIPNVSSEHRKYIPMGFISKDCITNNSCSIIPNGTLYHFGILTSAMHIAWVKYICGRLKGDFRYSNTIVYNNFPWTTESPLSDSQASHLSPKERKEKTYSSSPRPLGEGLGERAFKIEKLAQKVLDVRGKYPDSSLADLYDPLTMPPDLVKAHNELDKAVDLLYRPQPFTSEANRMEFLFELYEKYTANLFTEEKPKKKKNSQTAP